MTPPKESVRIAIAGASSLLGKELSLWIEEANFPSVDIRLLDEEIVAGTLTEAGGEPAVIETVTEDSFERVRFAFFTGSPEFSQRHAAEAQRAGAVVIDLSGGLGALAEAKLWIPSLDSILQSPPVALPPGKPQSIFLVPSAPSDAAISISAALASASLERLAHQPRSILLVVAKHQGTRHYFLDSAKTSRILRITSPSAFEIALRSCATGSLSSSPRRSSL